MALFLAIIIIIDVTHGFGVVGFFVSLLLAFVASYALYVLRWFVGNLWRNIRARPSCRILAAALMLVGSAAQAAEEPWRPVVRQCDKEAEQTFCVGKAGCPNWEWLSACAAQNYFRSIPVAPSQSRYVSCVERVKRTRMQQRMCASCGDPVAEVFACLGQ